MIYQLPKFRPRNFQIKVMKAFLPEMSRVAVSASRGMGKDITGLACADMICNLKKGANVGYLGTSLKALKKILFVNDDKTGRPMFQTVINTESLVSTRTGEYLHKDMSNFQYKNGSKILLLGTDQNNELGTSLDALIVTESARFSRDKWKFLRGNVDRANGRILEISTPFFASEFNELLDGNLEVSKTYTMILVPATEGFNADGTRVYDDAKLEWLKTQYDEATFLQEYMVSTKAMNNDAVLGHSLKKAKRIDVFSNVGYDRELWFSFDLGQSDYTVMFTWYKDSNLDVPVLIDSMIRNQTSLNEFIDQCKHTANELVVSPYNVKIILPFDANNDLQGYAGKLNRKREIEQNVPEEWTIKIIQKMNIIRMLQLCRMVIETGKLGIIDDPNGDYIIKILSSVNYKRDGKTGNLIMEVDKRSGMFEDHPIDSFKYFVAEYFRDMFDEETQNEKIKKRLNENILGNIDPLKHSRITDVTPKVKGGFKNNMKFGTPF